LRLMPYRRHDSAMGMSSRTQSVRKSIFWSMGEVRLQGIGHLQGCPQFAGGVTYVSGLNCHPCLRTVPSKGPNNRLKLTAAMWESVRPRSSA
jgi:hypothetical protein